MDLGYKIKIHDETHCKEMQNELFKMGYRWSRYGIEHSFVYEARYLYAYTKGMCILYGKKDKGFDSNFDLTEFPFTEIIEVW